LLRSQVLKKITGGRGELKVGERATKETGFKGKEVIPVGSGSGRYKPRGAVTAIKQGAKETKTGTFITYVVAFAARRDPLPISIFDVETLEVEGVAKQL